MKNRAKCGLKDKTGRSLRKRVGEELHGLVGEGEPGAVEIAAAFHYPLSLSLSFVDLCCDYKLYSELPSQAMFDLYPI